MSHLWRPIAPPVQAIPSRSTRIRTRIELGAGDPVVLGALGTFLGHLLNTDLAERGRARSPDRTRRKRQLTASTSSRWAGAITHEANRLYAAARSAQRLALRRTVAALHTIRARLRAPLRDDPPGGVTGSADRRARRLRGYASPHERAMKRRRWQRLEARAARLRADLARGRVHVCRGGKVLARHRHHLAVCRLTEAAWRTRWESARAFIHANGESGKRYGNETIRVYPGEDGSLVVEIDLPPALAQFANGPHGRYRLRARPFAYRSGEWEAHIRAHRACAYDIVYAAERNRWYLDASFTPVTFPTVPRWVDLRAQRGVKVLGVDLNGGHLSCAVLDGAGNPCDHPVDIPLGVRDLPVSTRDGHLRAALSAVLHLAREHGCHAIACEFLDFEDARATSREQGQFGPRVRATILGIPTAQVRDRLERMAARAGLVVVYVDPAYSSIWGARYWQRALDCARQAATRHHAAAVVLGRRALGHSARRREEVTALHRRMEAASASADAGAEGSLPGQVRVSRARGLRPPPRQPGSGRRRRKTGAGKERLPRGPGASGPFGSAPGMS